MECGQLQLESRIMAAYPPHSGSFKRWCPDFAGSTWNSTSQAWTQITRASGQAKAVMKSRWVEFSSFEKKEEEI